MEISPKKLLGFSLLLVGLLWCGLGLWLMLSPAQYQATARIEMNTDSFDIPPNGQGMSYDPFFIQAEFDAIQSQVVLGKVANSLNLNVVWAKKYAGGGTLATNEVIAILKNHLHLAPVRNTKLIDISFTSSDPNEAARIANSVAEAYQVYRLKQRNQDLLKGIEVLEQKYRAEEKKLQTLQTNVDLLREKYKINKDDEASFGLAPGLMGLKPDEAVERQKEFERTKPFWDEKRELQNLLEFHKALQAKINQEKIDLQTPGVQLISIIDVARPPKSPVGPNRSLGAVLLAMGLLSTAVGFLMLRSSRPPA